MENKDKYGRSFLFDLIVEGNLIKVEKYLKIANEINLKDKNGKTPLHLACIHSMYEITKFLISKNADLNIKDNNGNTPLFDAVFNSNGDVKIITILVENGANPLLENNYGISPLKLSKTISNFDVSFLFN